MHVKGRVSFALGNRTNAGLAGNIPADEKQLN